MVITNLYFKEDGHRYYDDSDNKYTSVTTLLSQYYTKFDSKKMARMCYISGQKGNPKYAGKTASQLEREWADGTEVACEKGTIKHNYLEDIVNTANRCKKYNGGCLPNNRIYTINDIIDNPNFGIISLDILEESGLPERYPTIYKTLKRLTIDGFKLYTEIGVYNSQFLICGRIDLIAIRDYDFIIIDWKTNKAPIKFESGYFRKDNSGNLSNEFVYTDKFFKYPLSHIPDSTGYHYALQLSTYAYLTEQFGLNCLGLILFHIRTICDDEEEVSLLPIEYMKYDCNTLINYHGLRK